MPGNTQTATAMQAAKSDRRLRYAMQRLLHALKPFVQAYQTFPNDTMPPYDVEWVTGIDGGPERVIHDALQAHPELWAHALPPEVCIVPREALERGGYNAAGIESLVGAAEHIVTWHAARHLHEAEERERARR